MLFLKMKRRWLRFSINDEKNRCTAKDEHDGSTQKLINYILCPGVLMFHEMVIQWSFLKIIY